MASSSMKKTAVALAAAAGLGGIHTAQSNAAASVTYILSKDDNGLGVLTPGEFAVYAVDTSSASNQGIAIFGVSVTGMTSVGNQTPWTASFNNNSHKSGNEQDIGFNSSLSGNTLTVPISGSQNIPAGPQLAFVKTLGFGQNAANSPLEGEQGATFTFNSEVQGNTDTYAGPSSAGGFQFGLALATGTFTGSASTIAFNASTTNDVATVYTDGSFDLSSGLTFANGGVALITQDLQAVPEPAAAGLLTIGAMGFLARRRRRQAKA